MTTTATSMIPPSDGRTGYGISWMSNGHRCALLDEGIAYLFYFDSEFSGAIDSAADANLHASANHFDPACAVILAYRAY